MWFILGFICGVLAVLGALFGLFLWSEKRENAERLERWANRFGDKADAIDRKLAKKKRKKPVTGLIGTFVLDDSGEIERVPGGIYDGDEDG